ncbi:MAG: ABC transporter ATP-binding protein [Thermoplasmata archaeon]
MNNSFKKRHYSTNVYKSYFSGAEVTKVLDGACLSVRKGELVLIMGPSGSGKTTLLNVIGGIDRADKGCVIAAGEDISSASQEKLRQFRRKRVGFIFQFYNLIPTLTASENIEIGLEALNRNGDIKEKARKYLKLVELEEKWKNFPQELSGGEQQRVAIARALAKEPEIVLADEPTGNLDEAREETVMNLMKRLKDELKITFIVVSHNPRLKKYADRLLLLRRGRIVDYEQD